MTQARRQRAALAVVAAFAAVFGATGGARASDPAPDPHRSAQWALDVIDAPEAWASSTGTGAVVAVVDTGVDLNHPDLQGKLIVYPDADFVDPRGNCTGRYPNRTCVQDGPEDANGHGTMVAGITAAVTDNGIGIAGVAPDASVLPVRVLDRNGDGTAGDVASGIRFAADKGADVINLSLSFDARRGVPELFGRPEKIYEAIDHAWDMGAVVVVAAGNDSVPACAEPSRHELAFCVAATDRNDLRTFYSNSDTSGDFIVAPGGGGLSCGGDVISTYLFGVGRSSCSPGPGYEISSGTSLAVPHVSGVAALLSAAGLTNGEIVDCLKTTSVDLGMPGTDSAYGYGRVDADAAMGCLV